MPHPCVVCGRARMNPNNRDEEYVFFGFPVNYDDRCKKWLEFCGREDLYKLTKKQLLQRMVCSKHFEKNDFLNECNERLNCTAVPSIYDPKQSLYNITCVLCGRYRKDPPDDVNYDGTTFHHFPGEEFRCLKWLDFVGVDSYYRLTRKEILFCFICSHHFDKSQFMPGYRNRLVDNAVPNIRNPNQMDGSEQFIMEILPTELKHSPEKPKELDPLPPEVLESQACAACGRSRSDPRNRDEKYKFHPFPAYEVGRCLRWCQFLGREDLLKMSPNQIRKLVLCSKHFLSGQSFQKVGSCDAVPTIRDVIEMKPVVTEIVPELRMNEKSLPPLMDYRNTTNLTQVSSKKPAVKDKPSPLAKKRGKSKRSTTIRLPKVIPQIPTSEIIDTRVLRKLPIPPTLRNGNDVWNLPISNPIAIGNLVPPVTNVTSAQMKRVIVPKTFFTGDISSLGKPIPVPSLANIPPGLLIKIDMPETKNSTQSTKKPRKARQKNTKNKLQNYKKECDILPKTEYDILPKTEIPEIIEAKTESADNREINELLEFSTMKIPNDGPSDAIAHEEIVRDDMEEFEFQNTIAPEFQNNIDMQYNVTEEFVKTEQYINGDLDRIDNIIYSNVETSNVNNHFQAVGKKKMKTPVGARARRTLLPIKSEINRFLKILKPQMRRLPKKARAQLKLSIVTMVIDHL